MPPEIVTIIEEQQDLYPGVFIDTKPVRNYIYKYEGAHALGYVSEISDSELEDKKKAGDDSYKLGDIIGKFGLENTMINTFVVFLVVNKSKLTLPVVLFNV